MPAAFLTFALAVGAGCSAQDTEDTRAPEASVGSEALRPADPMAALLAQCKGTARLPTTGAIPLRAAVFETYVRSCATNSSCSPWTKFAVDYRTELGSSALSPDGSVQVSAKQSGVAPSPQGQGWVYKRSFSGNVLRASGTMDLDSGSANALDTSSWSRALGTGCFVAVQPDMPGVASERFQRRGVMRLEFEDAASVRADANAGDPTAQLLSECGGAPALPAEGSSIKPSAAVFETYLRHCDGFNRCEPWKKFGLDYKTTLEDGSLDADGSLHLVAKQDAMAPAPGGSGFVYRRSFDGNVLTGEGTMDAAALAPVASTASWARKLGQSCFVAVAPPMPSAGNYGDQRRGVLRVTY